MGRLIPWVQVTIAGFVYIAAAFFLLLNFIDDKKFDYKNINIYIPYLAIIVVFLSYAVGYAAHLGLQTIIEHFFPQYKITAKKLKKLIDLKENKAEIYKSLNDNYSNLVMFRHLSIATFLLGITLFIWLYDHEENLKWIALITCIFFTAVFLSAYCSMRRNISESDSVLLDKEISTKNKKFC